MKDQDLAIQARALSKDFGRRAVLRRIDLNIVRGESIGLTGANGAGKTTLLRCLAAVVRPTSGEVRWFGSSATGDPTRRRLIGMVAHESRLYPHLTLHENLLFAARMYGVSDAPQRAERLLNRVGLTQHARCLPGQVSKGMCQRVAAARAMVHDPRILLLDEPFSGLDAEGRQWLIEMLDQMRAAGRTICLATHDETVTQGLADRVWELQSGRLRTPPRERHIVVPGLSDLARAA